jgi:acyl transferase domain-containing protein/NADPH:quinone reductase-like Zn-dependent oxidoreductase/acyl carrier protein/NADP-dependent 3-hydroxy acid dehydrogenase YdfG
MNRPASDIAIVGYACRLPNARNHREFWSVLENRACTVTEVEPDRWNLDRFGHDDRSAPGKSYTWAAGQIEKVWDFDPAFFGISPREALQMDPQQRLLLQVVYEALENAGIPSAALAGTETGVYVGASSFDYSSWFITDAPAADVQVMTGNTLSIVSNRISYAFDLRGPSFTVDTACSSSLVALHEAVEAMRTGRIDSAIVGGVNLLLSPFGFIGFSRAAMLSPTGLCRAFDADGDGYVRSEGAVVVVLKTLAAAEAAGDTVLGVIAGSGINADGRTNGLSLPSSEQQGALLAHVYERFGIDPADLAFIEAHGTGTRVGDPAEAKALGSMLGVRRTAPLAIGSVKTNIGHLEAASGLAGLLKAQMALENGVFPASLHFDTPNPDIAFDELNLAVADKAVALPKQRKPYFAGVNSFGFGGANAHVVIRQPLPGENAAPTTPAGIAPLLLSARAPGALRQLAALYRERVAGETPQGLARLTNAAAYRRDRHEHRLVALGATPEAIAEALDAYLAGRDHARLADGRVLPGASKVAFVFSGNGSQWAGMGVDLYDADAGFRRVFDEVSRLFEKHAGWSLAAELASPTLEADLAATTVAQPMLFAIQVALVEALAERGLVPDAVAGHSVGEVAAAYAAGAFDLETAVRIVHLRSEHQGEARGHGTMAAVLAPAAEVESLIAEAGLALSLAAVNSPRSITISGTDDDIAAFAKLAKVKRIAVRRLKLEYPFHSAIIDPLQDALIDALGDIPRSHTTIPFASTVTGKVEDGPGLGADYWWRNVRQAVLFQKAIETLSDAGCGIFVEIGPKPVLQAYVKDSLAEKGVGAHFLPTLDSTESGRAATPETILARVLAHGGEVDDAIVFGPRAAGPVALPNYPWQNEAYRIPASAEAYDLFGRTPDHPLLGSRARPGAGPFIGLLDPHTQPFLADHKVETSIVFPAAGFVELALAAAAEQASGPAPGATGAVELSDFEVLRPLVLDGGGYETRVEFQSDGHIVEIFSRRRLSDDEWALHARGRALVPPVAEPPTVELPAGSDGDAMDAETLYRLTRRFGLDYGEAFRRATTVDRCGDRLIRVQLEPREHGLAFQLDPTLLDASFHGLFVMIADSGEAAEGKTFLPVRIGRLRLYQPGVAPVAAVVTLKKASPRSIEAAIDLVDADGLAVACLTGVRFKAVALSLASDAGLVWRNTLARLAPVAGGGSLPTAGAILARAAELALVAETPPDADPGVLLVDAAVRRIAYDALAAVAGKDGRLDPSDGSIAVSALPLAHRLLGALAEDAAVSDEGGAFVLAAEPPYPALAELVGALVAETPRGIAEVATLTRLAVDLSRILKTGLPEGGRLVGAATVEHLATASPSAQALGHAASALFNDLAAHWPAGRPMDVLVVGGDAAGLGTRFAETANVGRVVVSDTDTARVGRLALALAGRARLSALAIDKIDRTFDLVVVAGDIDSDPAALLGLRKLAASGARLIVLMPAPSVFADAVGGVAEAWWSATVEASFPVGRRADLREWQQRLERAGFSGVAGQPLADATADGFLVVAEVAETAGADAPPSAPAIVIAGAGDPFAAALAARLGAVSVATGEPLAEDRAARDVVHVVDTRDGAAPSDVVLGEVMAIHGLLAGLPGEARLWLVARGGHLARSTGIDPVASALWGLGRVLINEAGVEVRLVDVDPALSDDEAASRLAREIAAPDSEREILIDGAGRAGLRIESVTGLAEAAAIAGIDGDAMRGLVIERQGTLDSLVWRTTPRMAPGAGEVEISVEAAGLNFRDVMWALGLLPEEALEDGFAGATLGMECSGTITAVGPDCRRFAVGDRVIAFAPACFATHVRVAEKALAPLPDGVDLEAAATIPVTFLTAYYALAELARIERGETILIHGGAGGVGLAALQIALSRGARVFATAGSPEKRELLRLLGAERVFDSRSLSFADEVVEETGGIGVDVVLNSLSGEAMERSIACLRPFGRFVELGKRDYYSNTRIGLRPFRQNLSYFGVDADQLLVGRPVLTERLFGELVAGFADGTFTPLPYRRFTADRISDAFRLMQQSGHIGKIIVRPPALPAKSEAKPVRVSGDGTYLVVGGLGGFGVETAAWLVARGARHLMLISRSGTVSDAAADAISRITAAGAEVRVLPADATDRGSIDAVLREIEKSMPPLRGVLHTAMVLDDGLFSGLDRDRIERVLAPKVAGAAVLDAATRGRDIDLFVLFSSATTLVGNPGQANYVAANAYLEGLAARRRSEGLPGLAVAWGAISDVGYLARNADVQQVLSQRLGRDALTGGQALAGLGLILDAGAPDAAVAYARMDWAQAMRELPIMATPLMADIAGTVDTTSETQADGNLARMIEGMDLAKATKLVVDILAGEISRILRLPVEGIDPQRPLTAIGMDSLMALELRMTAEQKLGVDIPLLALANGATLAEVARRVVERSGASSAPAVDADTELAIERHVSDADEETVEAVAAIEEYARNVTRLTG